MRRLLTIAFVLLAATLARGEEAYPARPITLVVPFPPGGVTDTLARLIAERMKTILKQTIVVENVGGAGGSIGMGRVARATPDGYTIAIGSSETNIFNAVSLALNYDVVTDFAPIVQLPAYPFLIVSANSVPATTLKELVAWIKANPAKVTQGTVGYGNTQHLCGILMQKAIGVTWQLVPYRGGTPAMQDLLSGQFNLMCTASGSFLPLVRGKQIRAYAITTPRRAASAPEIPTVDEAGLPGLHLAVWILCERHPRIVTAASERGWELIAHNYVQADSLVEYRDDPAKKRAVIVRTLDAIEKATGRRPKGWLSSGLRCTVNTSDILKELGLTYHCDYMNDEQPYLIETRHGPLVSMPYTQEINDIGMFLRRNFTAATAFETMKDEFDELYRASEKSGRIMSIGLHPHIIGRAFRVRALREFLDYAKRFDGVWWATREEIAAWYLEHHANHIG